MKKILFSLIAILMIFCFVSCDQLLENKIEKGDEKVENQETIFDAAAKTCTVDVEDYAFSTGTWDYKLLSSTPFELDPEVGTIGTINEEVLGYCYIFGAEEDSKVITIDTYGKITFICASEEIFNGFMEDSEVLSIFGFSENAKFDEKTLSISEIVASKENPVENETTYGEYFVEFYPEKTNADNTAFLSDFSNEYGSTNEIYVKRNNNLPKDDNEGEEGDDDENLGGDENGDDDNNGELETPEDTETDFETVAKTCTVDIKYFYDFTIGIWDYKLLNSSIREDTDVGPIGTFKEETIGYCNILGTERDSKVTTIDTYGKITFICVSEEIFNSFMEDSEVLSIFGFSENAKFDEKTLSISEIVASKENPVENETTYSSLVNGFYATKTNADNTAFLNDFSDEYGSTNEIYVKRNNNLPEDDNEGEEGDDDENLGGDENGDDNNNDDNDGELETPEDTETDFDAAIESCTVEITKEEFVLTPGTWDVKVDYSERRPGTEDLPNGYIVSQIILGYYETENDITTNDTSSFHFSEATLIIKCLSLKVYNDLVNNPNNLTRVGFNNPTFDEENLIVSETFVYNIDTPRELPYFENPSSNETSTAFYSSKITDEENYYKAILVKREN